MEVSMAQIGHSAALSVVVGVLLGIVYDVIRFSRVLLSVTVASPFGKKGIIPYIKWVTAALGDLCFFAVAAVLMCVFFFLTGDGRVRGYGLLGAFCGFEIYYHTAGRLFIGCCDRIAKHIRLLARRIFSAMFVAAKKILLRFLKTPIVTRTVAWYNKEKDRAKAATEQRKRHRRMNRNKCIKNGF